MERTIILTYHFAREMEVKQKTMLIITMKVLPVTIINQGCYFSSRKGMLYRGQKGTFHSAQN